ncbi:MAG: 23S rRNA (adenine(2503)-C(2))-methyltransferase RlmN [Alphaproteobacteria bacterium TMED93]|nr:MAG: 23S rRNA (adenine(2503)-C(2))-methyltransferase RlmN [Alphaproteobacteria bacterium TMED93]|tara:strand:+ start:394 stop:1455 length:1062 start_codon:yes stop_codon:yes gene_type:complete
MSVNKKNIYDLTKKDLKDFIKNKKIKLFRVNQIWNWLYVKGSKSFFDMNNLSNDIITLFDRNFSISLLEVKKSYTSEDGTKKWLFKLKDNREIETVFIPEGKRGTICVSSQVGCSLSCSFCHTGTMKLERNLELEEILGQIITVKFFLEDWKRKTEEKKVTNIVFMGMGEPLLNYNNVINSINILCDTEGLAISKRKITLSTSGIVNKIKDFQRDTDVNLAVSLHAAFDDIRDELVPVNKKWPIARLFKELEVYNSSERKKRITFEYIMLEGVNDSIKDAKQLIKLISPLKSKVNLIPFNPWPDSTYNVSSPEKINNFKKFILENGKIIATIRIPRGDDILAACGQLKSLNQK